MEKAIFISKVKSLKFFNKEYSRLYFGNEFCQRLLPFKKELESVLKFVDKKNVNFSFVTPFVTDEGLKKVDSILKFLAGKLKKDMEVVFNDWGVWELIERYPFKPVLGRLLTKQKRGPRILDFGDNFPKELMNHFKRLCITSSPKVQKFLNSRGVKRIELDNLLQGIDVHLIPSIKASLYFPYAYVTTTRLCLFQTPPRTKRKYILGIFPCKKECQKYTLCLEHGNMPVTLFLKGNTQFFKNEKLPEKLEKLCIDRIVYEPEIPI